MKKIKMLVAVLLAVLTLSFGVGFNEVEAVDIKTHSIRLDSKNYSDVKISSTYTAKNTLKVKMPDMGTYTYTDKDPTVIIRVVNKTTGKTVRTQYVTGKSKMSGATYSFALPAKAKYYVKITGNISQLKAKTWIYTGTFY